MRAVRRNLCAVGSLNRLNCVSILSAFLAFFFFRLGVILSKDLDNEINELLLLLFGVPVLERLDNYSQNWDIGRSHVENGETFGLGDVGKLLRQLLAEQFEGGLAVVLFLLLVVQRVWLRLQILEDLELSVSHCD